MQIMKPLLEHPKLTLLTFDFTMELGTLYSDDITIHPNTEHILDGQLGKATKIQLQDLLAATGWKSLSVTIQDAEIDETTLQLGMKEFPWDVNHFVMKIMNLSNVNMISKDFMKYSSNDIFYTAITGIILLKNDLIEPAKEYSLKKLQLFKEYYQSGTLSYPGKLRQAKYLAMNIATILQSTISDTVRTPTLLKRWSEIDSASKLMNHSNPKIQSILNLEPDDKTLISQRLEEIEKLLTSADRFNTIKSQAIFVKIPGQKDEEEDEEKDPFQDLL